MTSPYGYTSTDNSIFGAIFILSGVIGSFIFGMILDKTAKFKLILNIICIVACISVLVSIFTLPIGSVPIFAINLLFVGASVIPIIPICYSFSVELTYPISEAMSNGMMVMVS